MNLSHDFSRPIQERLSTKTKIRKDPIDLLFRHSHRQLEWTRRQQTLAWVSFTQECSISWVNHNGGLGYGRCVERVDSTAPYRCELMKLIVCVVFQVFAHMIVSILGALLSVLLLCLYSVVTRLIIVVYCNRKYNLIMPAQIISKKGIWNTTVGLPIRQTTITCEHTPSHLSNKQPDSTLTH